MFDVCDSHSNSPTHNPHDRQNLPSIPTQRVQTASMSTLSSKHVVLVAHRPTPLVLTLATSFSAKGAHVTLALRHPQDATLAIKRLSKRLPGAHAQALSSSSTPLNISSLSSISAFADSINNSPQPLDLLLLDTWDLHAAGRKDRRWYTEQGLAGTAQTGFVGPAVLLHLLRPKLAASGTCVLLTASPAHRLAALGDVQDTLTAWGHSPSAATQAALLSYTRRLALQLQSHGVKAAAVDLGVLAEQPLKGSLLDKVPVLHQALNLLLPSAHDAATLLVDVASHLLSGSNSSSGLPAPDASETLTAGQQSNDAHTAAADAFANPASPATAGSDPATATADAVAHPTSPSTAGSDQATAAATTTDAGQGGTVWDPVTPETPALQDNPTGGSTGGSIQPPKPSSHSNSTATQPAASLEAAAPAGPKEQAAGGASAAEPFDSQYAAFDLGKGLGSIAHGATAAAAVVDSGARGLAHVASTNISSKPFSYISQGLLAHPLLTALDHTGTSTWLSRALHTLASPLLYSLTSTSLITTAMLADWPVRALLLRPMGLVPAVLTRLGPLGAWATWVGSQLQSFVPGVVGVPPDAPPAWVEVQPSGVVLDDKLGWGMWYLADTYATQVAAQ